MTIPHNPADFIYNTVVSEVHCRLEGTRLKGMLRELAEHYGHLFLDQPEPVYALIALDPRMEVDIKVDDMDGSVEFQQIRLATAALPMPGVIDLDHIFTYHSPAKEDLPKYERLRDAARIFAAVIVAETPRSADQTDAVRKVREAVMTANAAIALGGRLNIPNT